MIWQPDTCGLPPGQSCAFTVTWIAGVPVAIVMQQCVNHAAILVTDLYAQCLAEDRLQARALAAVATTYPELVDPSDEGPTLRHLPRRFDARRRILVRIPASLPIRALNVTDASVERTA